MAGIKIIVGLGNPGKEYVGTRHNAGFDVIDGFARRLAVSVEQKKFGGLFGETLVDDTKVILLKPQEWMNLSGQAVATAAGFYKLPLDDLMVVADDAALGMGMIRIRPGGSSGGHNGLRDIIMRLGTDQFARLRVGIGSEGFGTLRDFVLSRPGPQDVAMFFEGVKKAQEALWQWIHEGLSATMNQYNTKNRSAGAEDDAAGDEKPKTQA
jgi:peptidyl-tRNA hydrolase, PTH1 family